MLFLWQLSLFVSILTLIVGVTKKSWISLLISTITSLPIAYYFLGAENTWKYVSLIPIVLLVLIVIILRFNKKNKC